MRKKIGYTALILSFLVWGSIAILPFVDLPYRMTIGLVLYAISYIMFFVASYFLGKELMQTFKTKFASIFWRKQRSKVPPKDP